MAAAIRKGTGIDAEIVEGNRGEFTVWVGDRIVVGPRTFEIVSMEGRRVSEVRMTTEDRKEKGT